MNPRKFNSIAARCAGIPADEHWAAAFEAARDVAGKFGTARMAMLFLYLIVEPGPDGAATIDFELIAARAGLPLDIAEALLDDLADAGFVAYQGRGKWRRVAYPFVSRQPVTGSARVKPRRPPARPDYQCELHH